MQSKYAVTITIGITAKNAEEARAKMVAILKDGGDAVTTDGKFLRPVITDPSGIRVVKI
jgi:hypothetical protein